MKTFLGAGSASAIVAAVLLAFGGSGQAFAQQVKNLPVVQAVVKTSVPTTSAAPTTVSLVNSDAAVAREAGWLQKAGWPLYALVDKFSTGAPLSDEANCIAVAVYHEARGESLEGQMAVALVIKNRAMSGKYPSDWCGVVKQPWQFSFVRHGQFPSVDVNSEAWRKAVGITRLAVANAVPSVPKECLWYHANYVAPRWSNNLQRVEQIGAHIFYRS